MSEVVQLEKDKFEKMISDALVNSVDKVVDEKLDKVDLKYHIHPEMTPEQQAKQFELEQEDRFINMVKFIARGEITEARGVAKEIKAHDSMLEGTDADGGYLVPAVTQARILRLIPTFGQLRNEVSIIPMGKADTINIPKYLTGVSVAWVSEGATIGTSHPTLETLQLVAKKLAGITSFSNEVLADANVELINYVLSLFAQAFGTEEDSQGFAGTGSPFTGIFNASSTYGNNQKVGLAGIDVDSLTDAVYDIDQAYLRNAAWYMHRTVFAEIRKLKDNDGLPIVQGINAGGLPQLLGFGVKLIENAPTAANVTASMPLVLLGDLKNSILGDKAGMSIKMSDEATVDSSSMYQFDLSAIRLIKRMSFNAGMVGAYSAISNSAG